MRSPNGPTCVVTTQARCVDAQGTYRGDNVACAPTTCPRPCTCDWDRSGAITPVDLTTFITDFLAGTADFNGDGRTDNVDLVEFINCYTNPPASCGPNSGPVLTPAAQSDTLAPRD